jgi:O-antigen/teichoic acid export membrane protein
VLRSRITYQGLLSGTDQVLAMLSNVLVAIFVGRLGGVETLGAYSYAFAVYLIFLGLARALVSEPFLTHELEDAHSLPDETEQGFAAATTSTIVLGGAMSVCVAGWGLLAGRAELLVLGAFTTALLLHDLFRYAFFRWRKPQGAVVLDGIWVLCSALAVVLDLVGQPALAVAGWATGALGGVIWAVVSLRVRLMPLGPAIAWWKLHARRLGSWLTVDSIVFVLASQVPLLIVTAFGSDGLLGSIRAVQIIIGPLALLVTTLNMLLLPRFAQRVTRMTMTEATRVSALATALTGMGLVFVIILREPIADILFGGNLELRSDLLLPLSVLQLSMAAPLGAALYIRSRRRARELVSSRVIAALASIPLVVLAAWWASAPLLAWTLATQGFLFTVAIFAFCRVVGRREVGEKPLTVSEPCLPDEDVTD